MSKCKIENASDGLKKVFGDPELKVRKIRWWQEMILKFRLYFIKEVRFVRDGNKILVIKVLKDHLYVVRQEELPLKEQNNGKL